MTGSYSVGGLVGENSYGTVSNSYAMGSVTGSSYNIGGLIGYMYGGSVTNTYSTVFVGGSGSNKGGLIGSLYSGTVTSSYWDTETSGMSTSAGGTGKTTAQMKQQATFSGWDFTNIWNIINGSTYPWLMALGIPQFPTPPVEKNISTLVELNKIGRDWDYPWDGIYYLVNDIDASETVNWDGGKGFKPISPFTGKFYGNGHKIVNLYINRLGEDYVGLFGRMYGEVRDLGVEDVTVTSSGNYVGGLVGENYFGGTVSGSYSTGTVMGSGDYVGGLVGKNWYGTVSNSYAMGSVTGSSNYIGGLIGYMYGGSVTNTYSTGLVGGSGSNKGGLIGNRSSGTVTSSYWDTETSGMNTSAGGEGKTTTEMKQQTTFVDWDFTNIWDIVEQCSYLWLRALPNPHVTIVPDILGLPRTEAEETIQNSCLIKGEVTQQCSDTVPTGSVISQSPAGGEQVPPGSAVDLVVSTGLCPVTVPDVVGMTQTNAESAITGAGLTVGSVSEQCSDTVPAGNVISQDPTSGQQVPPGTAVNLVISTGPCPEGEGTLEGEGVVEGTPEGTPEGTHEGEGTVEGTPEGTPEGVVEGTPEGTPEGEGTVEGTPEGEGEGGELPPHSADQDGDGLISLTELLRVIQFFNFGAYHCDAQGEDGYAPGPGDQSCQPHASDYNPSDWSISLSELLRVIQFFNSGGYHPCPGVGEDGYCPGP